MRDYLICFGISFYKVDKTDSASQCYCSNTGILILESKFILFSYNNDNNFCKVRNYFWKVASFENNNFETPIIRPKRNEESFISALFRHYSRGRMLQYFREGKRQCIILGGFFGFRLPETRNAKELVILKQGNKRKSFGV